MTSPRPINPDGIPDNQWWDCEALKLAVVDTETFRTYTAVHSHGSTGARGLYMLGFTSSFPTWVNPFDEARVANFGEPLIAACKRVSK